MESLVVYNYNMLLTFMEEKSSSCLDLNFLSSCAQLKFIDAQIRWMEFNGR